MLSKSSYHSVVEEVVTYEPISAEDEAPAKEYCSKRKPDDETGSEGKYSAIDVILSKHLYEQFYYRTEPNSFLIYILGTTEACTDDEDCNDGDICEDEYCRK